MSVKRNTKEVTPIGVTDIFNKVIETYGPHYYLSIFIRCIFELRLSWDIFYSAQ